MPHNSSRLSGRPYAGHTADLSSSQRQVGASCPMCARRLLNSLISAGQSGTAGGRKPPAYRGGSAVARPHLADRISGGFEPASAAGTMATAPPDGLGNLTALTTTDLRHGSRDHALVPAVTRLG